MKTILAIALTVCLSGCVELAWNSSGRFATQSPDVDLKALTYSQKPIKSNEVVNHNMPTRFSTFGGR